MVKSTRRWTYLDAKVARGSDSLRADLICLRFGGPPPRHWKPHILLLIVEESLLIASDIILLLTLLRHVPCRIRYLPSVQYLNLEHTYPENAVILHYQLRVPAAHDQHLLSVRGDPLYADHAPQLCTSKAANVKLSWRGHSSTPA